MQINTDDDRSIDVKKKDLIGCRVRSLHALSNHHIKIPKGWEGVVDGVWRRTVHIQHDPCDRCGVAVYMRQIPLSSVVLITEG